MTVDGHYPTGFQVKSKTTDGTDPSVEYFRKGSAASLCQSPISTASISVPRATCT